MTFIGKTTQTVNQNVAELLPQWELNLSDNVYMYRGRLDLDAEFHLGELVQDGQRLL